MVITPRDAIFVAIFLGGLVASVVVLVLARKRVARFLTRHEWTIAAKLGATLVLAFLLLLFGLAMELPAEMFIYGRF